MKQYRVTDHAIQRAVERLGLPKFNAANHLVQLMQTAYYNGDSTGRKVYDHYKSRTRLIVSYDNEIITVYKVPEILEPKQTVFSADIVELVRRRYAQYTRQYRSNIYNLEVEKAELNLELAQLQLNLVKAKSPKVRDSIKTSIDELVTMIGRKEEDIEAEHLRYEEVKEGAEVYL